MDTANASEVERINKIVAALFDDFDADRPVQRDPCVRTLVFPCDTYTLPAARLSRLRAFSLEHGVTTYYVKSLLEENFSWWHPDNDVIDDDLSELRADDGTIDANELRARGWVKLPDRTYWRGIWDPSGPLPDHSRLLEHALIDGAGAWAIAFSQHDYAFLVATVPVTRQLLELWNTTPTHDRQVLHDELEAAPHRDRALQEALAHAIAGDWERR